MFLKKLWILLLSCILGIGLLAFYYTEIFSSYYRLSDLKSSWNFSICFQNDEFSIIKTKNELIIPSEIIEKVFDALEKHFDLKNDNYLKELDQNVKSEKTAQELNEKFANLDLENIVKSLSEMRKKLKDHLNDTKSFKNLIKKDGSYLASNLVCFLIDESLLDYLFIFDDLNYKLYEISTNLTLYAANLVFDHKAKSYSGLRLFKNTINRCIEDEIQFSDEICFIETYTSVDTFEGIEKASLVTEMYKDTNFNFWVQFYGLIFLFLKTSFYDLVIKLIEILIKLFSKILKNQSLLRFIFVLFKWLILSFSFVLTVLISSVLMKDYIESLKNPIRTEVSNITTLPENVSLIICVPVQLNLNRKIQLEVKKSEDIFKKHSFESIENYTNDDLKIILKQAYLKKGIQMRKVDLKPSKKVYFKNNYFESLNTSFLSRCFRIELEIQIALYRDLQIETDFLLELDEICYYKNKIFLYEFTENLCQIYLLDHLGTFSSKTFLHKNSFQINKRRIERSKSFMQRNCSDYSDLELNCFNQQNCIELCINKEFSRKYKSLSIESETIIDKDELNQNLLSKLHFNKSADLKLIEECKLKFLLQDCSNSYFIESYRRLKQSKLIEINLDFEILEKKEFESSVPNLIINLFNVIILIFGLNVNVFLRYFSFILRIGFELNRKWIKCSILILSVMGFLLQFNFIYVSIVKAGLVSRDYHLNYPVYPQLTFCFDYSNNLNYYNDLNFKLTGNYLEEQTSNLTIQNAIENISVTDHHKNRSLVNLNTTISYFFLNKKCFSIDVAGSVRHRFISDRSHSFSFEIRFNREFLKKIDKIYFKNSGRIENILDKQFGLELESTQFLDLSKRYQIKTESIYMSYKDEFKSSNLKFIAQLFFYLLTFGFYIPSNEDHFEKIRNQFSSKFNYETLNFHLESNSFDQEISDDLFEQFYSKNDFNFDDYSFDSSDSFVNYLQIFNKSKEEEPDLELIAPIFNEKVTLIQNEEGLLKFMMAILNALSFWFDRGIFELNPFTFIFYSHYYVYAILCFFAWLNLKFKRTIIQNLTKLEELFKNKLIEFINSEVTEFKRRLQRRSQERLHRRLKSNRIAQSIETNIEE